MVECRVLCFQLVKFLQGNYFAAWQLSSVHAAISTCANAISNVEVICCFDNVLICNSSIVIPYGANVPMIHCSCLTLDILVLTETKARKKP
ncbi:hypothetical protein RHMOL_Rhmol10G0045000 [Rhododendron molle]|uniref:Uncharacterized protein n=1 Tax=Rhododendron molle TaxID=49168 RepID=A0ACC0LZU4_RHOML|nr:hypothetical protein RHMOL_Rhmol10G0045000 [Rhododendron molle]